MDDFISIVGAKEHNLKNVDINIPRKKLVVFTGVSGSGKSTIVFDTIYAESQRQLLETFSAFTRKWMPRIEKPKVDAIRNISPAIKIDQKRMGENRRSTLGTATEISTYLRLLFSRAGQPFIGPSFYFSFNIPEGMCPSCHGVGTTIALDLDKVLDMNKSLAEGAIDHYQYRLGGYYLNCMKASRLFDMDKKLKDYTKEEMDRLLYLEPTRLNGEEHGVLVNVTIEGIITGLNRRQFIKEDMSERDMKYFKVETCPDCHGTRLNERALSVKVNGKNIAELSSMELTELYAFLDTISGPLTDPMVNPMKVRLKHLIDIGVGYLSLDRPISTLSGGESQRVKMARQLSCDLVDMIYVFDEPSIGLHPRDIGNLVSMLRMLRDKGNSILVVEHDPAVILEADHVIDVGPGAGTGGGNITFSGSVDALKGADTMTGKYLSSRSQNGYSRRTPSGYIEVRDASLHNLKNVSVRIPTGVLVCVTGVAGSGKSTLINDIFTARHPDAIVIDQSPVGRSNRSNPATYIGAFDKIREEFARANGVTSNLFSFNSDGACPKCNGQGFVEVEMHFLENIRVTCTECGGKRYTKEVLDLKYKGKNIAEVLEMTVDEALAFFEDKAVRHKLGTMKEVGLGYLTLGQTLSSLSGGEAQRLKLAEQLHKKGNIYVMDEPTTGLHMADVQVLLDIIHKLVKAKNTVIVIEHNLDVIKHADWVIDMGPEGGRKGGEIIAEGTPEDVAKVERSYTGRYLREMLPV
ncbi:putative UvrABC system protein A [Methanocella paludicola SANAE]|uniref:UvrABC system protein A n=1 Tax=Methanocella paludicola (strain DSM 17711 / JCM 13418 / NBRC 101707 / SANAE) TaxID=304371 RepID=D1Z093_METPS|nr:excinuclease ABC subunit UvrA [Methanocella paludicola]BAI62115.1 putative UvrABC system protein A [Methanocella paludicola SANAE]